MFTHHTSNTAHTHRGVGATVALLVLVLAGLARLAAVTLDDYQDASPTHSVTEDSAITRRSLQMVAVGLQALVAANGPAASIEVEDAMLQAGAGFHVEG